MGLAASLVYGGLRACGVTAVSRRARDAGLVLCYHNVVATEADAFGDPGLHLPRRAFERQMRWLADHYTVVSLREFVERMRRGPTLASVATVTFDDGYTGVFEHAVPVLDALGIAATVFIVAEALGRSAAFWWDEPEIVAAARGVPRETWLGPLRGDGAAILSGRQPATAAAVPRSHRPADAATIRAARGPLLDIGVHSATHRSLPTLTDSELDYEIVTSRDIVTAATGAAPEFFAYPYGLWDPRVRDRIRAAGYRAALTLDLGLNRRGADPWALRRVNVPAHIPDAAFEAWAAGLYAFPRG